VSCKLTIRKILYTPANTCVGSAGATAVVKMYYATDLKGRPDFTCSQPPFTHPSGTRTDAILDLSANLMIWISVETAVTIISASIPFLRVLIKGGSSYGPESGSAYTGGTHQLKSMSTSKVQRSTFRGRDTNSTLQVKRQDDRSDRSILSPSDSDVDGIVWTNEITVTYHEGGEQVDDDQKDEFDFGQPGT
jgi:hypothetical protein